MSRRAAAIPALAGLLLAGGLLNSAPAAGSDQPAPFGREVEGSSRQLQNVRQQIAALRDELSSLSNQHEDAEVALRQVTREIGLVKELLAGLDQRELILDAQRDSLQAHLATQREIYELRRGNLAARLRAIFKQGPQRDLQRILTAESVSALVARWRFQSMLARLDASLVQQTRRQGQLLEAQQQQLQAALAGIWEAREEARRERERLELLEAERRGLLRELAQEQDRATSELARLQRQARQLQDMLARFEARREREEASGEAPPPSGALFVDRRGQLPWPAAGAIVRDFGRSVHPRFGTVTMHNGLSLAVAPGAPVQAVAPGKVEFADHLPGFGRCVILDHGAGHYTLYANLARIFASRGEQVGEGQILAEMGAAGENGRPELYFEVREGREARNPREWLRPAR